MNPIMTNLQHVAEWTQGSLGQPIFADIAFERVSTDTRALEAHDLFIALKGERFDAHDFLSQLQVGQVAAVVAEHVPEGFALPYVLVSNTRTALQALSHQWRNQFKLPLTVVTGSNGKTTVKEMLASIINHAYPDAALATQGNLNNDIGLPLTLLKLKPQHQVAVIELGMNHPGETAQLAPIAAPTVGLINNAQREHQEFMQTVEAVAQEHADVFNAVQTGGTAVFPADDTYQHIWREHANSLGLQIYDFSIDENAFAAFTARYELGLHASTVQLITPFGQCTTQINIPGVHNVHNALAACAAATAMNIGLNKIAQGLSNFMPGKGRLQTHTLSSGQIVIDDTYNANPDSVRAAINVLADHSGRKILVLGDFGEVGDQGPAFHQEVGAYAKEKGIDLLLATGDLMPHAVAAFGDAAQHFTEINDIFTALQDHLNTGEHATILVKGSRFMRMERVVNHLLDSETQTQPSAS